MDFINFHIAYLLAKHKQVIIPDFGAFVVSPVQENQSDRRTTIPLPVKYTLSFNPEIIKNDGLLVHSIAKEQSIGEEEALRLVYEYIDKLVNELRVGQTIQFPWIGKIYISSDRKIVFIPTLYLSCNAATCGLADLDFPYLSESSEDAPTKRKKSRKWLIVCSVIAVIAFSPVVAALITGKDLTKLTDLRVVKKSLRSRLNRRAISRMFTAKPKKPAASPALPIVANSTASVVTDSVQSQYFIIIASVIDKKEAEEISTRLTEQGLDDVKIILSDGKYRISIKTFADNGRAVVFLDSIRKEEGNPLYKDAWVLEDSMGDR
jgi:nucleoid DNA-binding protein